MKLPLVLLALALSAPTFAAPKAAPKGSKSAAKAAPKAASRSEKRPQNVAGVSIAGLDATARSRRLKRELNKKLSARVLLTGGALKIRRARRDVGLELDMGWMMTRADRGQAFVPLKLRVNLKKAATAMKRLAPRFERKQRDARIVNQRRGMEIVPEVVGQTLNIGASVPRLAQAIERDSSARTLALAVRKQTPQRTRADFKGITGRLATFSTGYNEGKRTRSYNMVIASQAIDGTLVKPGGTFSLNDTVGERTRKRGYQAAIIFEDGKKTQGLGGGVSQVTGTLFNAALLAGLPISTYTTHSRPVAYLPIGRDATVAWGNFDMKFKNNTGAPLYISYLVKDGTATASIFGRRVPRQRVRLAVSKKSIGPRRIKANLYRTIIRGGKPVVKQKVGDSDYNWKADDND